MKRNQSQPATEAQLLELLKNVLPKATGNPSLAGEIYHAAENELKSRARAKAFEKFCQRVELPNLEPKTLADVRNQFESAFGDGEVTIISDEKEQQISVEVNLPDGRKFSGIIKVHATPEETEVKEIKLKFVSFPVCMPGDKELVWMLAKRENMTNEEAGIALTRLQDDFWGSKTGQKLLRDRVERIFPEFISRVPTGALNEVGLKRHYKMPEVMHVQK